MNTSQEASESKKQLALELLALLRGPGIVKQGPSPDEFEMTEPVALGHQKRDNKRFRYPVLRILIGPKTYSTLDWSLGGLMIGEYDGDLRLHQRFKLTMSDGGSGAMYYAAECRVTRADKKGRKLGMQFTTLSKGGMEWLGRLQLLQRSKRPAAQKPKRQENAV